MYQAILSTTYFTTLVLDDASHPVSAMPGNQGENYTNRKRSHYQSERKDGTSRTNYRMRLLKKTK